MKSARATVVVVTAIGLVAAPTAADAGGGAADAAVDESVTTVATGLAGPRQLDDYPGDRLVVAESDSGEVSTVDVGTGEVTTLLSGLWSPQGVAEDDGELFVALGGPPPPDLPGPLPAPGQAHSALITATPDGTVRATADLLAYELEHNPDGQVQMVDGKPVDALSNPFSVLAQPDRILVADGGANDVLAVDRRTGEVSTFFVPPLVTPDEVPACANAQANPGTVGCDPVPTGVVLGRNGMIYVSTLGSEVPGAGRVYVLTQRGKVVRVIDGLQTVAGVEVDRHGTVYAAEILAGSPEGEPGPDFDPSTIGQLARIDRNGHRSYAPLTMPVGLEREDGELYAVANSLSMMPDAPPAGEVVRVDPGAFTDRAQG